MRAFLFLTLSLFSGALAALQDSGPAANFTLKSAAGDNVRLSEYRGQVVLIDVWTFGCWNCYRSFPWLNALEARLADAPFQIVGIHSPEFAHERDPAQVRAKIAEFGLRHPVMLDNDFAYWRALGNRYWPAYYLVDKHGDIRELHVGETHEGDARARAIEERIGALLAE